MRRSRDRAREDPTVAAGPDVRRGPEVAPPSNRSVAAALGAAASRPLAPPVRASLEASFGVPLSDVRVRADGPTETAGGQISGVAPQPATPTQLGRLAHEVAHVVQARGDGPPSPSTALEAEARQAARDVVGGRPPAISRTAPAGAALGYSEDDDPRAAPAPRSDQLNPWEVILGYAEAERAALQASGINDEYEALLQTVRTDLVLWREFRGGSYELSPLPGIISANAAEDLKTAMVTNRVRPPFTQQTYVASLLRDRLSDQEFAELGGLARFANSLIQVRGAKSLGELFGLSTEKTTHTYEFHVRWDWSLSTASEEDELDGTPKPKPKFGKTEPKIEGGFTVGATWRAVRVRYTNLELGMTYTVNLDVTTANLGAEVGAGVEAGSGLKQGPDLTGDAVGPGGDELIRRARGESEEWLPAAAPPATFWRPDDFAGGFFVFKAEAGVSAQVGQVSVAPIKGEAFELFVFNKGRENLVFAKPDAAEEAGAKAGAVEQARSDLLDKLADAELSTDPSTLASLGVEAGLEFEAGWATKTGFKAEATAPEVEAQPAVYEQHALRDTTLYFDTEKSELSSRNLKAIEGLAAFLSRYALAHPDVRFVHSITGYASPRWKGAGRDRDAAADKNYDLSSLRAHNVLSALSGYKDQVLESGASGWECREPEVVDLVKAAESRPDPDVQSVEPLGSAEAFLEGKGYDADDAEDRRVLVETDVVIDVSDWV